MEADYTQYLNEEAGKHVEELRQRRHDDGRHLGRGQRKREALFAWARVGLCGLRSCGGGYVCGVPEEEMWFEYCGYGYTGRVSDERVCFM